MYKYTDHPIESLRLKFAQDATGGYDIVAGDQNIANVKDRALAARIVACVNACAGMENPAALLDAAEKVTDAAIEVVQRVYQTRAERDVLDELHRVSDLFEQAKG